MIDSAKSVEQLRMRLLDSELEDYGESFVPEFVYEVIRRLPRFSTMRVCFSVTRLGRLLTVAAGPPTRRRRISRVSLRRDAR